MLRYHPCYEAIIRTTWWNIGGMERPQGSGAGWMLQAPILAMSALAVPWFARRCYAAFFKTHILMAAATLVGVALHGFGAAVAAGVMPLAIPGGLLWLLDLALRAAFGARTTPLVAPGQPLLRTAGSIGAVAVVPRDRLASHAGLSNAKSTRLRLVPATVQGGAPLVAVSLPSPGARRFTAGQWVFLCVPRLGALHWHPFTIASSSHDPSVEFAVACKGTWTQKLAKLAASQQHVKVQAAAARSSAPARPADVHMWQHVSHALPPAHTACRSSRQQTDASTRVAAAWQQQPQRLLDAHVCGGVAGSGHGCGRGQEGAGCRRIWRGRTGRR